MSLIYTAEEGPLSLSGKPHGLYLGGKVDAKSRSKLEGWGITHILNVTPEKEAGVKVRGKVHPILSFPISHF
jgi:hypothetical protein